MFDFTQHVATRLRRFLTPRSERIPRTNPAWTADHRARLDRFLILGSEGGTYYIGDGDGRRLRGNATAVTACIDEDGPRVVRRVVEISRSGRAPKNDPALFVLAMAASADDVETRIAAVVAVRDLERAGTSHRNLP